MLRLHVIKDVVQGMHDSNFRRMREIELERKRGRKEEERVSWGREKKAPQSEKFLLHTCEEELTRDGILLSHERKEERGKKERRALLPLTHAHIG